MNSRPVPLLQVTSLTKRFRANRGWFSTRANDSPAIEEVSLEVGCGEIVGLVGESGSGKSTLARCILRLVEPDSGSASLRGVNLSSAGPADLREARRRIQIVFQDSGSALSPRRTIRQSLQEPLEMFEKTSRQGWPDLIGAALDQVGLDGEILERLPGQLSSGQQQRVALARALLCKPELIIADEAVSALDVSVQAQVLALIRQLRDQLGIAFLFISHDLAVIAQIADRVVVMYQGRVVEQGPAAALFGTPAHPYTRSLMAAIPDPDPAVAFVPLLSEGLSGSRPTGACAYEPRCTQAMPECTRRAPRLRPLEDRAGHHVECLLYDQS